MSVAPDTASATLLLQEERVAVSKRTRKTMVRAARTTTDRAVEVDEDLSVEQVVVTRVPVGRVVETMPPVREENGVTIVPVVEEEVVLVRRLVLKEEVHFKRVQSTVRHVETVTLKRQEVIVTRIPVTE